jgi:hypothetical protein
MIQNLIDTEQENLHTQYDVPENRDAMGANGLGA